MVYRLIDIDGNFYELNGDLRPSITKKSFQRGSENYNFDQRVVEKSFLDGSTRIGTPRLMARKITLSADFAFEDDIDYDDYLNELVYWAERVVTIQDITNDKEAEVAPLGVEVNYDRGSIKRSGLISLKLNLLNGYWEDITETSSTQSLPIGVTEIPFTNDGWLTIFPVLTVTVAELCTQVDIYVKETKEGIQIIDASFGIPSMETLVIDCKEGTTRIADFDRSKSITPRTGYFPVPVGASNIVVEVPVACDFTIAYKKRYYS